jgi:hypothetical protein
MARYNLLGNRINFKMNQVRGSGCNLDEAVVQFAGYWRPEKQTGFTLWQFGIGQVPVESVKYSPLPILFTPGHF